MLFYGVGNMSAEHQQQQRPRQKVRDPNFLSTTASVQSVREANLPLAKSKSEWREEKKNNFTTERESIRIRN